MNAKELAVLFHNTYETMAPQFGYETRKETRMFDATSRNGQLMIAVSEVILRHLTSRSSRAAGAVPNCLKCGKSLAYCLCDCEL